MNNTPYTLVRTRRKTVAIYIRADGTLEVRAPLRASAADIGRLVAGKAAWIARTTAAVQERTARRAAFLPDYGDTIALWGRQTGLLCGDDVKRVRLTDEGIVLPSGLDADGVKNACIAFYRAQARAYLPVRADQLAREMGVTPARVGISGAKTRWGSCSSRGNISLSWYLAMADPAAADYVVVHELAHLIEHNHSPRFWAVVERVLPDYRHRQAQLRELQQRLAGEDWSRR